MADSYVCSKAKIKCSCGDRISTLTVFPDRTIWLTGQPQANISDHIPMRNIAPFGRCHTTAYPATGAATAAAHGKLTPMPCVPNTPFPWMGGKNDVILQGQPALLKSSKCKCIWGGTITITFDGQTSISNPDLDKEERTSQDNLITIDTINEKEKISVLDGIQTALDVAGFVPGFGAIPDLLNAAISACRGNWLEAGMSLLAAVPLIGDGAAAARLCYKGAKMARKVDKTRKALLSKSAKNYISKDISADSLLKDGICRNMDEVEFFQKSLRHERKEYAYQFYKTHGVTNKKDIVSNINGIDLNHAVKVRKMPPPNEFQRFEAKEGQIGGYMSMKRQPGEPIKTPRDYGILPVSPGRGGNMERKVKRYYRLNENTPPFEFLESTASPCRAPLNNKWDTPKSNNKIWKKTRGGATQYYVPYDNLKFFSRIK